MAEARHEGRTVHRTKMHNCPDCTHVVQVVKMTLEFEVATIGEKFPSSQDVVDQLSDALPREWLSAGSGDDWWLRNINP